VCVCVCVSPSRISRALFVPFQVNNKKSQEWGKQKSVFNKNSFFKVTIGRIKIDQLMNNYRSINEQLQNEFGAKQAEKLFASSRESTHNHSVHHTCTPSLLGSCSVIVSPVCMCMHTHAPMHVCTCTHTTLHSNYSYSLSFTIASCPLNPSLSLTSSK